MMMLEGHSVTLRVPCLHALPDAQRSIVELLYGADGVAISRIARELGVTASAIRPQLAHLEQAGLVTATTERGGSPGRPRHLYRLTMTAQSLFTKREDDEDSEFMNAVLREIRRRNPELVADVVTEISTSPSWVELSGADRSLAPTQVAASAS